MKVLPSLFPVT